MFSGFSDWADGKIARLVANQSSRLGELLDPAVDRIYMVTVPVALAVHGIVPWWIVILLIGRDALLAATLPVLRSRGLTALPVTYIGKGATFALMSAFPLILLGQWDALWSRVILACGWAFLIWGMALYLWSGVLYLIQVAMVARRMRKAEQWLIQRGRSADTARRPDATPTRPTPRHSSRCRRCCGRCCPTTSIPAMPPLRPSAATAGPAAVRGNGRGRCWPRSPWPPSSPPP